MANKGSQDVPEDKGNESNDYEDLLKNITEGENESGGEKTTVSGDMLTELLGGIDSQDKAEEEAEEFGAEFDSIDLGSFDEESGGDYTSIIGEIDGLGKADAASEGKVESKKSFEGNGEYALEGDGTEGSYNEFIEPNGEEEPSEEATNTAEEDAPVLEPEISLNEEPAVAVDEDTAEAVSGEDDTEFSLDSFLEDDTEEDTAPDETEPPVEEEIVAEESEDKLSLDALLDEGTESIDEQEPVPAEETVSVTVDTDVSYGELLDETEVTIETDEQGEESMEAPEPEWALDTEETGASYDSLLGDESVEEDAGETEDVSVELSGEITLEVDEGDLGYGGYIGEGTVETVEESDEMATVADEEIAVEDAATEEETELEFDLSDDLEETETGEFTAPEEAEEEEGIVIGVASGDDDDDDFLSLDDESAEEEDDGLLGGIAGGQETVSTEVLLEGIDMDTEEQIAAVTQSELMLAQGKTKEAKDLLATVVEQKGVTPRVSKLLNSLNQQ